MFKKTVFWCEFPKEIDWKKLEATLSNIHFHIKIYILSKSLDEFLRLKKNIQKTCSHIDEINVWPILDKKEGYWFSGFTTKEKIKELRQFSTLNIKIDLELPIPKKEYSNSMLIKYFTPYLLKKGKNSRYLFET